jgi:hypothetical protein
MVDLPRNEMFRIQAWKIHIDISAAVGFSDLFITFTCNPNWPEIQRLVSKQNLKAHDRPDIITRVFKIKLTELLKDLTKKHVLGKVVACKFI